MKKLILGLITLTMTSSAFAIWTPDRTLDPDPIKKKAALILMINQSLSDLQAQMLRDSLFGLTIEDLEYISKESKDINEIIRGLEERAPDDEDEHGADTKK